MSSGAPARSEISGSRKAVLAVRYGTILVLDTSGLVRVRFCAMAARFRVAKDRQQEPGADAWIVERSDDDGESWFTICGPVPTEAGATLSMERLMAIEAGTEHTR